MEQKIDELAPPIIRIFVRTPSWRFCADEDRFDETDTTAFRPALAPAPETVPGGIAGKGPADSGSIGWLGR